MLEGGCVESVIGLFFLVLVALPGVGVHGRKPGATMTELLGGRERLVLRVKVGAK